MERYDGKTRKDDIKKWTLISIPILLVLIGLFVGMHFLKKGKAPDYTVVTLCDPPLSDEAMEDIRAAASVLGDLDGNGKVNIAIKELRPGPLGEFDESVAPVFLGDYVLFLISRPDRWGTDILASKTNLTGTKFWLDLNRNAPVYGCILNTDEDAMAEAERVIEALQAQEMPRAE